MSGQIRSKHGCWTCRLRKKKCDEHQPLCTTCDSLSITCYGYGVKPEWMDNGERERAVANSLKEIVKITSRKRIPTKLIQNKGTLKGRVLAPAPRVSDDSSSSSPSPDSAGGDFGSISIETSALLMHFLDDVFPLQYPAYKADVLEGGRGWLLHLLLRTKPLYHAALALSSYHRLMVGFAKLSNQCRVFSTVQQEEQLRLCLEEVQGAIKDVNHFIQKKRRSATTGLVASVVQLVFFELFAGENGVWQIHLEAAIDMYRKGCTDGLSNFGLSDKSKALLYDDSPLRHCDLTDDGPAVVQEVATFRFMGATIIWLDLIASITAGTAPRLLPFHFKTFRSDSQTRLENIVGCPNWLALQIGRVSNLQYRIADATQRETHSDCAEIAKDALDIGRDIQIGLATARETSTTAPTSIVFACMAVVYLHLIVHGFQQLDLLDCVITEAMPILQTQTPSHLLSAMISPLFILGCRKDIAHSGRSVEKKKNNNETHME
ncbi:fungal-specific transcription factor domain-containing protein [Aspergillus cavernicola]|uniref:Fungal-specific transcription factor domain-containing protein n=1 Tax=Aspergillus cavernicola TaxID=176166 RepID=A0ABR4IBG6_9EURO